MCHVQSPQSYLSIPFDLTLAYQTEVHDSNLSKWEQHLLQAFLVEMTYSSMTANVKRSLPLNKRDLDETHVAYWLALIHSNLQFKPTIWAEPSPESFQ